MLLLQPLKQQYTNNFIVLETVCKSHVLTHIYTHNLLTEWSVYIFVSRQMHGFIGTNTTCPQEPVSFSLEGLNQS